MPQCHFFDRLDFFVVVDGYDRAVFASHALECPFRPDLPIIRLPFAVLGPIVRLPEALNEVMVCALYIAGKARSLDVLRCCFYEACFHGKKHHVLEGV